MRYVRWLVILAAAIAVCVFIEKPHEQETAKEAIGKICNCFTVPGVVFAGVGGLSYISHLGGYDSFGYTFSNFSLHNIWVTKSRKKYDSFYDYKQKKDAKGRKWLPHVLQLGIASLAVGAVLLVIYLIL